MPPISSVATQQVQASNFSAAPGITVDIGLSAAQLHLPSTMLSSVENSQMQSSFFSSQDAVWTPPIFTWTPTPPTVRPASSVLLSGSRSIPHVAESSVFAGPTLAGDPGIAPLLNSGPIAPRSNILPGPGSSLSDLVKTIGLSALNITNIVTTKLNAVEDYLSWRTQFESFLVSNGFLGILNGSIPAPPPYLFYACQREVLNPDYCNWLKLDQTVRSWLFATLSRDVLIEVRELKNASAIWGRLESHFMSASLARSMELKRQLTHSRKSPTQSMDHYLRAIKDIADNLACINSPVSTKELFETILLGLGRDYESLITSVELFPESFTFEKLRTHLIEKEQTIQYMRTMEDSTQAQAFAGQVQPAGPLPHGGQQQQHNGGQQQQQNGGRGQRGRGGRGQRGRGGRGGRGQRGRGYGPHQAGYGFGYGYLPPGYFPGGAPHAGILGAPGSAGSSSGEGNSVPPPVVCQICYAPGHPASTCPSRFTQPAAPALAAHAPDASDFVWYPDSGASAHMTPHLGPNNGGGSSSGA
ncbi:unnamed protein product [Cuscuta epithymum]|uniref:Retrotransposon gag domain-containing protein n=1 Tax=Cuscuta epithymum TaxID=186058 RepID=A0AAV0EVP2_9ASTE|nr:unnamed protein product [Cuscuta epithymum]